MELSRQVARKQAGGQRGMSLIELMIAMVVLAVGMGGIMALFTTAIASNNRNKIDTAGTMVAQLVLEQIASVPGRSDAAITITDCAGAESNVSTAPGGSPVDANGNADFTAAAVAGYQMLYTTCGAGGQEVVYDVRWNVQRPSAYTKIVTVSARQRGSGQAGASPRFFARPTTLRTIAGS